jgi:hypothetical protein
LPASMRKVSVTFTSKCITTLIDDQAFMLSGLMHTRGISDGKRNASGYNAIRLL